jgi:hypothetical protein
MWAHSNEIPRAHLWVAPGECFPNEFCSGCATTSVRSRFAWRIIHTFLAISLCQCWQKNDSDSHTWSPICENFKPLRACKTAVTIETREEKGRNCAVILMGDIKTILGRSRRTREYTHSFLCLRGAVHIYAPLLRHGFLYRHSQSKSNANLQQTAIRDMKHWETPSQGQFST